MKRKRNASKSVDFPRKKRKLGKGKRPPDNATNISFKSRSVVLPSQLEKTKQPTGKRKLTFQALLSHLNHFKASMRQDGLNGLRDLFQEHPHLLIPNLTKLVAAIFSRITDQEASVRHALHTLLGFLFPLVSPDHIFMFLPTIVIHLSCGLTHINDRIQVDSLKVFNLLLKHYSSLLPPHAPRLLPLLLGLVSRYSGETSFGKKTSKGKASLASNPGSKLSKVSSRIEVFTLLNHFLETLYKSLCVDHATSSQPICKAPVVDLCNRKVWVEKDEAVVAVNSNFCDLSTPIPQVMLLQNVGLMYHFSSTSEASSPQPQMFAVSGGSSGSTGELKENFLGFSEGLISLLLECWVECAPSQLFPSHSSTSVVPENILSLMELIISLFCMVLKLSTKVSVTEDSTEVSPQGKSISVLDTLSSKFTTSFLKHFLVYFPFFGTESGACTGASRGLAMNLTAAQIVAFLSSTQCQSMQQSLKSICAYYLTLGHKTKIIKSSQLAVVCSNIIAESTPQLLDTLESQKLHEDQVKMLDGIWTFYNACHPQSSAKKILLQCFKKLREKYSADSLVFSHLLLPWLKSLPKLLEELAASSPEVSSLVIDSLVTAGPYMTLVQFEDSFLSLNVTKLPPVTQRQFAELLWILPSPVSTHFHSQVAEWICSGALDTNVAKYMVEIMHHRYVRAREDSDTLVSRISQYLGFMLNILLGECISKGIKNLAPDNTVTHPNVLVLTECKGNLEQKLMLIETACECLKSFDFSHQVLDLMTPALQTLLSGVSSLRINKAAAILRLVECLSSSGEIPSQLISSLAQLCLSVLSKEGEKTESMDVVACVQPVVCLLNRSQFLIFYLLQQFCTCIEVSPESEPRRGIFHTFIGLLNSTHLNSALRRQSKVIQGIALSITTHLQCEEQDLLRLNLAMKKYDTL